MAKYKISVIGILLANGLMGKANEIVDEEQLTRPAKDMVDDGYIRPLKASELKAIEQGEKDKKAPFVPEVKKQTEEEE